MATLYTGLSQVIVFCDKALHCYCNVNITFRHFHKPEIKHITKVYYFPQKNKAFNTEADLISHIRQVA